jgi:hypothetical protein
MTAAAVVRLGFPARAEEQAMKVLVMGLLLVISALLPGSAAERPDVALIFGRIQFVTSFPDYKVKEVGSFADLHVQKVSSFPDRAGRWQIVDSFPDYKIQIVDSFPDFTIKYVDSFPGPQ